VDINKESFQQIELTLEQALQYLRKETLHLSGYKKGFTLMTYNGVALGWVNVLDNRINNMYPANWRIRMAG
jgi:NOL1/NOP2/fmu family ribosome biogenesis protein